MRKPVVFVTLFLTLNLPIIAQFSVKYQPDRQPTTNLQYFTPTGENLFVGDCIPFAHNGMYYLYWLIDQGHHSALNGLGGHQWVLSTTKDLRTWTHYPVVLGIDEDWEKSICTGSVVYRQNKFHAFYATRRLQDGKTIEQLSYAISDDGIHFKKQKPNPFFTALPAYSPRNFRDPKAIINPSGGITLLIASNEVKAPIQAENGCLVQLTSSDMKSWQIGSPILTGQFAVPECPDYFKWNQWYYLVYGQDGDTYYLKSKSPLGPWESPRYQSLKEEMVNVAKTAEFAGNRRIAAAWIPSRRDNKDNGGEIFGGSAVFREVIQEEDGTLSTQFPAEMIPPTSQPITVSVVLDKLSTQQKGNAIKIQAINGLGAAHFQDVPVNSRITLLIEPSDKNEEYGLFLRSDQQGQQGYKLRISANERTVGLGNTRIEAVEGLDKLMTLDIVMRDDIIDVCINGKRCLVNRMAEQKGTFLWLYAKQGSVAFKSVTIAPIRQTTR
ncbi:MAG: hypothetical protein JWP57_1056 [Spirosoma sp.]|nr:hypothetical protein [Spirosoma sp.]